MQIFRNAGILSPGAASAAVLREVPDMSCFDREGATFRVLVNEEEQYSIWPDYKAIPAGWRDTGTQGDKAACLAYVESVWTDMRPSSLRRHMEAQSAGQA